MAGNGRPQKYHDCVEPYLAEIKKMAKDIIYKKYNE